MPPAGVDLADIQGNTLRSYGRYYRHSRHLVLRVVDGGRARMALARMIDGDRSSPEITFSDLSPHHAGFEWCLNVGFTAHGLGALGVSRSDLATFPPEFREGIAARAGHLGDVGPSAPEHWVSGLGQAERVDLIVTVYGRCAADLDGVSTQVLAAGAGRAFSLVGSHPLDGALFEGDEGRVHFGYQDGISNVRFEGIHEPDHEVHHQPFAPIGALLLGYPSSTPDVVWKVPLPDHLGRNGTFSVFRVLRQDVQAFEDYLDASARATGVSVEEIAAKMCGRWRNGAPLTLAPTQADADAFGDRDPNDFGYLAQDSDGRRCPIGSHIRRSNPRDARIVQRGTNHSRMLVRRGMPYGPQYQPKESDPGVDRGLLGNFLCASIAAQFEAMQFDWLNLGLQDPRITGTNDPLVGVNDERVSNFAWHASSGDKVVLGDLPRFVRTVGGAYSFLPSRRAIAWIAAGPGEEPRRRSFLSRVRSAPT